MQDAFTKVFDWWSWLFLDFSDLESIKKILKLEQFKQCRVSLTK